MSSAWRDLPPEARELLKERLTARQLEVLRLGWAGAGNRRIATVLGLDVSTVRDHRRAITRRLVPVLGELALLARAARTAPRNGDPQ